MIAKAGTVIDKGHLMDTLPVVWELLLDEDQQLVSSVGKVLNTYQNDALLCLFSFERRKQSRIGFSLLRSVIKWSMKTDFIFLNPIRRKTKRFPAL